MILFLQRDTMRDFPVGFELPSHNANFFDPADDVLFSSAYEASSSLLVGPEQKKRSIDCDNPTGKTPVESLHTDKILESEVESSYAIQEIDNSGSSTVDKIGEPGKVIPIDLTSFGNASATEGGNYPSSAHLNADAGISPQDVYNTKAQEKTAGHYRRCIRSGCQRKPRFDSKFCSDACGVSSCEQNLLRSLEIANGMHPSQLRP